MKKIYSVLLLLFACVMGASAEKEIYAVYNGDVLTIQYDENREANNGATQWWESIYSSQRKAVTQIVIDASMADARPERTKGWFGGYENLEQISGMENLNTSVTTDMQDMFSESGKLTSIDLSHMETRYVRSMGGMFMNCESLKELNLFNFNISFLEDVEAMFAGCSNLERIYSTINWEMSDQITKSDNMFYGCEKLRGGNGTLFDPDYVDKRYARPDQDGQPGYFSDTKEETKDPEIYGVFSEDGKTFTIYYDENIPLNGILMDMVKLPWYGSDRYKNYVDARVAVQTIVLDQSMKDAHPIRPDYWFAGFENATEIQHLTWLNTDKAAMMVAMFQECKSLTALDLSHFDTEKCESFNSMFDNCKKLESIDISHFNTAKIESVYSMFYGCDALTSINMLDCDWSNVTFAKSFFEQCINLEQIICKYDFNQNSDLSSGDMFAGCAKLKGENGTRCDGEHYINAEYARLDKPGQPGYFSEKPQGLEQTSQEPIANSQKLIKDGQLFIQRGGKLFNLTGAEVK